MPSVEAIERKRARREHREQNLAARILTLPRKRYGVILADPGWRFEPWSRTTGMDRAADNHYATSVTEAIAALEVASIAAEDCVLFLWATVPMIEAALMVMRAWGFTYKSQAVWDKEVAGTGYWFRNQHEILLVGTRGKVPAPAMGNQWLSVIIERRRAHSVKPEQVRADRELFPQLAEDRAVRTNGAGRVEQVGRGGTGRGGGGVKRIAQIHQFERQKRKELKVGAQGSRRHSALKP